jgi:hypothetical protein
MDMKGLFLTFPESDASLQVWARRLTPCSMPATRILHPRSLFSHSMNDCYRYTSLPRHTLRSLFTGLKKNEHKIVGGISHHTIFMPCPTHSHMARIFQAASSNNQVLHCATDYSDFSDTITMEPWIQDAVRCWQIWAAIFSERTGLWIFSHHGLG